MEEKVTRYYLTIKPFGYVDGLSHKRLSGRVTKLRIWDKNGCQLEPIIRATVDENWVFAYWWWDHQNIREITEEQALDPNFRKFMYKMYSGDPDGDLNEIL